MWETVLYGKVLTDSMILNIEEGSEGLQLTWKISQRRDFGCNWSNSGLDLGPTTLQTSPILALPAPPIIRVNAASRGEEREGLKGDKGCWSISLIHRPRIPLVGRPPLRPIQPSIKVQHLQYQYLGWKMH